MTTKQEKIFEMVNSIGFRLVIKEEPNSDSNIFFEYYGIPWIFRKDGNIYSNGFNFNDRAESIEEIVPEFLISLGTFLEEGYGKRRLYGIPSTTVRFSIGSFAVLRISPGNFLASSILFVSRSDR